MKVYKILDTFGKLSAEVPPPPAFKTKLPENQAYKGKSKNKKKFFTKGETQKKKKKK